MDSQRSTVCRTSRVGWDAARCRGSQPRLSDSLKAKVCLSISLRVQTSPGHHGNRSNSRRKDGGKTFKKQKQPGLSGTEATFCRFYDQFHLFPLFPSSLSHLSVYLSPSLSLSVGLPASWCLAVLLYSCWPCDFSDESQRLKHKRISL